MCANGGMLPAEMAAVLTALVKKVVGTVYVPGVTTVPSATVMFLGDAA